MADEKEKDTGSEGEGGGEGGELKALIEALTGAGLTIPEEVSSIPELIIAVKASSGNGEAESTDSTDTTDTTATDTTVDSGGPIMMSMQRQLRAMGARLVASERQGLQRRIGDLHRHGKVSKQVRDKLLGELKKEQLSLDDKGNLKGGRLLARVEAYEELEGVNFGTRERLSRGVTEEVDPPGHGRPKTEKETDDVLADWDKTLGRNGRK